MAEISQAKITTYAERTFEVKSELVNLLLEIKEKFPELTTINSLPGSYRGKYESIMNDFSIPFCDGYVTGTLAYYATHPIKSIRARNFQRKIDGRFSKY
jgi:hypothetical protein